MNIESHGLIGAGAHGVASADQSACADTSQSGTTQNSIEPWPIAGTEVALIALIAGSAACRFCYRPIRWESTLTAWVIPFGGPNRTACASSTYHHLGPVWRNGLHRPPIIKVTWRSTNETQHGNR